MQYESDFLVAYDSYADAIFRYILLRVRDREVAKDITQDTFMHTWKYLQEKRPVDNPRAFLYTVAIRLIINHSHKHKEQSLDALAEAIDLESVDPGTVDIFDVRSTVLEGEHALGQVKKLNPQYREVIHLRFVEGLTPREIAEITGESKNVVSVRLHRAMKALRQYVPSGQGVHEDEPAS